MHQHASPIAIADRHYQARYDVRGCSDGRYPYVNDLKTLKEAVAIGRTYPGIYRDGAATHITRRLLRFDPDGSVTVWQTHRWRVFSDGTLRLDALSRQLPHGRRDEPAQDFLTYLKRLPAYPRPPQAERVQLSDLLSIAEVIGMKAAASRLKRMLDGSSDRDAGAQVVLQSRMTDREIGDAIRDRRFHEGERFAVVFEAEAEVRGRTSLADGLRHRLHGLWHRLVGQSA